MQEKLKRVKFGEYRSSRGEMVVVEDVATVLKTPSVLESQPVEYVLIRCTGKYRLVAREDWSAWVEVCKMKRQKGLLGEACAAANRSEDIIVSGSELQEVMRKALDKFGTIYATEVLWDAGPRLRMTDILALLLVGLYRDKDNICRKDDTSSVAGNSGGDFVYYVRELLYSQGFGEEWLDTYLRTSDKPLVEPSKMAGVGNISAMRTHCRETILTGCDAEAYVAAARRKYDSDDIEIDDNSVRVLLRDDGAFVTARVWVPNDDS